MFNKIRKPKPVPKAEAAARPRFDEYFRRKSAGRFKELNQEKQHYFLGFHDRLKRIDVKLSHNPSKIPSMEQVVDEDLLTSKSSLFIETLTSYNTFNSSLGYQSITKLITPLSSTFPMIVNNIEKIVEIIVDKVGNMDYESNSILLEFIIALIKDTRQLIFPLFLSKIMPKLISVLKIEDVETLDKVFTVFAYGFKFLQKKMIENLRDVYLCYYELLAHSNKYIRKFAAESFSHLVRIFKRSQISWELNILLDPLLNTDKYLLLPEANNIRKTYPSIEEALIRIRSERIFGVEEIFEQLFKENVAINGKLVTVRETNTIVIAISQLMGEVMQGTQGNAHSKAFDFLVGLLRMVFSKKELWLHTFYVCRYAMILLVSYLEHDKIVLEALSEAFKLEELENEDKEVAINLLLILWKEWIILNKAKHLSEWSATQILNKLNTLLLTDFNALSYLTQKSTMQCLAMIYSTKFQLCCSTYDLQSLLPIKLDNNLFKKRIFELKSPWALYDLMKSIGQHYASMLKLNQIITDRPIIHNALEFEVPLDKQKAMYEPLYERYVKTTFELLGKGDVVVIKERLLFVMKIGKILNRAIPISKKESENLFDFLCNVSLWKSLCDEKDVLVENEDNDLLTICLVLDILCKSRSQIQYPMLNSVAVKLLGKINREPMKEKNAPEEIYSEAVREQALANFVFPQYSKSRINFYTLAFSRLLILMHKESYKPMLELLLKAMMHNRTNYYLLDALEILLKHQSHDTYVLEISNLLRRNLCCNLRSVRLISLRILNDCFKEELINLLYKFEEPNIGLDTERDKALAIRDLTLLISSGKVSKENLYSCIMLSFGTLWNKFTPLHKMAEDLLFTTLHSYEDQELFEGFLMLVEEYFNVSASYVDLEEISCDGLKTSEVFSEQCVKLYLINEDYISIRLFDGGLFNMFKRIVKINIQFVEKLIRLLKTFIKSEYNCYFSDLREGSDEILTETEQLEQFRRVNVRGSQKEIQLRKMARNKMEGFIEVLAEGESLDKLQPQTLEVLRQVVFNMLADSNEKIQKNSIEILARTGIDYVVNHLKLLQEIAQKQPNKDLFINIDIGAIDPSYRFVY